MIINKLRSTGLIIAAIWLSSTASATIGTITNLAAAPGTNVGSISLSWTTPSGSPNQPNKYLIRYLLGNSQILTQAQFDTANAIEAPPLNQFPPTVGSVGSPASFLLTGLTPGASYSFSIVSRFQPASGPAEQSSISNSATAGAMIACSENPDDGKGTGSVSPSTLPVGEITLTTVTFIVDSAGIDTGGKISLQIPDFSASPSTSSLAGQPGYLSYSLTGGGASFTVQIEAMRVTLTVQSGSLVSGQNLKFVYYARACSPIGNQARFKLFSQKSSCGILKEIGSSPLMTLGPGNAQFLTIDPFEIVAMLGEVTPFDVATRDGCNNLVTAGSSIPFTVNGVYFAGATKTLDPNARLSLSSDMTPSMSSQTASIAIGTSKQTLYYQLSSTSSGQPYVELNYVNFGGGATASVGFLSYVRTLAGGGITESAIDKGTFVASQKSITFDPGRNERAYVNFKLPDSLSWKVIFSTNNFVTAARTIYGFGKNVRTAWDGYADSQPGIPYSIAAPGVYAVRIQVGPTIKDDTCTVTLQTSGMHGLVRRADNSAPIEDVNVDMFGPVSRYTRTVADGTFTAYGLSPGSYIVRFNKNGFTYKETNITVNDGVNATVPVTELTEAAILRLNIQRPGGGSLPHINGSARAYNSNYSKQAFGTVRFRPGNTQSDAGDDYNVTPTSYTDLYFDPNTTYTVRIEAPGFAVEQFTKTLSVTGVTHEPPRTLTAQPMFEGTVILPSNESGMWVSVEAAIDANSDLKPDSNDPSKRIYGGVFLPGGTSTGTYRIFGIPNGIYVLSAFAPGFIQGKINATMAGADVLNADFPVFSLGGTVTGTLTVVGDSSVLDGSNNDGKFEISINAYSPSTGRGSWTQLQLSTNATSTSGAYSLTGLEDGTYFVSVYQPGFGLNPPGVKTATVSGGNGTLNLTLERFAGKVAGKIILPSGATYYGDIDIDALGFNTFGSNPVGVLTGVDTYEIRNLGTDFYTVRARDPNTKLVVTNQVQVRNNATTSRDIDLSPNTFSISGRVTSNASLPYTISYLVDNSTDTPTVTPNGSGSLKANRVTATLLRNRNFNTGQSPSATGLFYDPKETYIGFFNSNGDYTINGLAPGAYRLSTNGEIDGNLSDGNELSESSIVVYVSNNIADQNLTISDGYKVSGTIRLTSGQAESGRGIVPQLLNSQGESIVQAHVNLTGTSVDFTLDKVQPGNYILQVQDPYPKKYVSKDVPIEIVASDVTNKEIQLLPASVIRGKFQIRKSGIVISASNYSQYLTNTFGVDARSNPPIPGGYGHSEMPLINADGYFNVALSPGTYDIVARDYQGVSESDIASGKKSFIPVKRSAIKINAGEIKDIGFLYLEEGGEISGTITDQNGNPVPNLRVEAESAKHDHDENSIEAFTDTSGKYVLRGFDTEGARYYDITASPRPDAFDERFRGITGVGRYGQVIKGPIDTKTTGTVDFTVEPANGAITASVVASDGGQLLVPFGERSEQNLPGAIVILNRLPDIPRDNPLGDLEDAISPAGQMNVQGLLPGVYSLYVISSGYGSLSKKNVVVRANQTTDMGTLTLPAGYTLSGKILKSNGDPVTTANLETLIAARDNFNEIAIAKTLEDASGNILSYSVSGIQPNKRYSILGFNRTNSITNLASNITLTGDTTLDLVYEEPVPGVLTRVIKSGGNFVITFKFDDTLRNTDIDLDADETPDDNEVLSLNSGNGSLSTYEISNDRKEILATYTPAAGETSFSLRVTVTFVSLNPATGENRTLNQAFTFFAGIAKQNSATLSNAGGGQVDLSETEDPTSFTAPSGWLGSQTDSSADVTLKAAVTQADLGSSAVTGLGVMNAAKALGPKAFPSEMTAAMARLETLDVDPFSSFYDIFLPAGVSHFFPEGKEARLCLSYDGTDVSDPAALNIYYYNPVSNQYLLEGENKTVDTVNEKICVNISHASVFTVLNSSESVLTGSGGYSGQLSVINFPNPFNLKAKTLTLQDPGSANASQTIEGTMIKLSVPSDLSGHAEIQIFGVAGEKIRTLNASVTGGAHYYIQWDGKNESGQQVASGTYIARLTVNGGNERFFKMAVLK